MFTELVPIRGGRVGTETVLAELFEGVLGLVDRRDEVRRGTDRERLELLGFVKLRRPPPGGTIWAAEEPTRAANMIVVTFIVMNTVTWMNFVDKRGKFPA